MKNKKDDNFLDLIPVCSNEIVWKTDEDHMVVIDVVNKGLFNKIAQKCFGKPKVSHIHLDELGSFIWQQIDGSKNVYDIAELVKAEFGDRAEPLYNRLVQYIKTLVDYDFIYLRQ